MQLSVFPQLPQQLKILRAERAPFIVIIQFEVFIKMCDKNPEEEAKLSVSWDIWVWVMSCHSLCISVALHFDLDMKHENNCFQRKSWC